MPASRPSEFVLTQPGALRIYDTEELLKLPAPTWLIQDVLPSNGLMGLYGPSGCGKTFVALDMALSVASGVPWQDKGVEAGFVLYVSAEGKAGLGKRIRAWLTHHELGAADPDIGWVTEGLPIYGGSQDLDVLFERFEELDRHPSLVIIDTLARCFEGDENLQKDMSPFVAGLERFRQECGAAIIVVHHTNADATRERGNTAFRAATDVMVRVMPGVFGAQPRASLRPPQGAFTLINDKQKDAELLQIGVGSLVKIPATNSCVSAVEWLDKDEEKLF